MAWQLVALGIGLAIALLDDEIVVTVRKGINSWRPVCYSREIDFRVDLAAYLRTLGEKIFVVEEHGKGRGRRDIWVKNKENDDKVVVELKFRLKGQNESHRLLGQILNYSEDAKALFVVLIDPEPNTLAEFEQVVKRRLSDKGTVEIRVLSSDMGCQVECK